MSKEKLHLTVSPTKQENTTYLQGVGHAVGKPAKDFEIGEFMAWNGDITSEVISIKKETKAFITFVVEYEPYPGAGLQQYDVRLKKDRIVAEAVPVD